MGRLDSDLEDLYRRRHGAFQVMLASVTGSVESARDVVQEAFARRHELEELSATLFASRGFSTDAHRALIRAQTLARCAASAQT